MYPRTHFTHKFCIISPSLIEIHPDCSAAIAEKVYGSGHQGAPILLPGFAMIAKPGNKTAPPSWPDPYDTPAMMLLL